MGLWIDRPLSSSPAGKLKKADLICKPLQPLVILSFSANHVAPDYWSKSYLKFPSFILICPVEFLPCILSWELATPALDCLATSPSLTVMLCHTIPWRSSLISSGLNMELPGSLFRSVRWTMAEIPCKSVLIMRYPSHQIFCRISKNTGIADTQPRWRQWKVHILTICLYASPH